MIAAKRIRGTFLGFLAGLLLSALWAALVAIAIVRATRLGDGRDFWQQVRLGGEIGGIAGAGLFLFYQPPLGRAFFALFDRIPFTGVLLFPLLVAYHVLAFPGVLAGRLLGAVAWAPRAGAGTTGAARGDRAAEPCPYEGRVVATAPVAFRNAQWTAEETLFRIHEDGRVSTDELAYWGWVDGSGTVREGTGDPTAGAGGDARVVATLERSGRGTGCFVGKQRIGELRRS